MILEAETEDDGDNEMVTAIVMNMGGETHLRRYPTDDPEVARRQFIIDWIEGKVEWRDPHFCGPECRTDDQAFAPEFLRESLLDAEDVWFEEVRGPVYVWHWFCGDSTGDESSDEIVYAHFVRHDTPESRRMRVSVIVDYESAETHVRTYEATDVPDAKRQFIQDWIDGKVEWEWDAFWAPSRTENSPAFTPEFLRDRCAADCQPDEVVEEVHIFRWRCKPDPAFPDEHTVVGYFVPHAGPVESGR